MTQLGLTLLGEQQVKMQLQKLSNRVINAFVKELCNQGFKTLKMALPITPMDTGDLRKSSRVLFNEKVIAQGSDDESIKIVSSVFLNLATNKIIQQIKVTVYFNTEYAFKVHEWKNPEPNWTTPGTGPDYLIKPFRQVSKTLHKDVEKAVHKALQGKVR